ncbi:segregation/condensation protein A [Horticoccus sp. 23ND18S-11]|uniref:segregation/condensation protein A n=1 Tax=Horticoccus sp. 23ND18S-11 TaxID=3391832 RepID=UPI0039C9E452
MVPDADYRIKLQVFEGPLDLLLFLIRKNELDIYDIPIESVTRQYIDALHAMQQLDLDVAGEFFVMAATLMEIKSRLLLPKGLHAVDPNAEDEAVDPRWELVHQLLQYKKFKEAAATLAGLVETRQNLMARHVSSLSSDESDRPLKSVDRIELWNTFNIVLRRLAEKLVVGEIHDEVVTVSDQMEWILGRIQSERTFVFSQLFPEGVTLRKLVATFLAMLELTRLKKLRIRQSEAFADIIAEAVVETPPEPVVETAVTTTPEPVTESAAPVTAESVAATPAPIADNPATAETAVPVSGENPLETATIPPTVSA